MKNFMFNRQIRIFAAIVIIVVVIQGTFHYISSRLQHEKMQHSFDTLIQNNFDLSLDWIAFIEKFSDKAEIQILGMDLNLEKPAIIWNDGNILGDSASNSMWKIYFEKVHSAHTKLYSFWDGYFQYNMFSILHNGREGTLCFIIDFNHI